MHVHAVTVFTDSRFWSLFKHFPKLALWNLFQCLRSRANKHCCHGNKRPELITYC